MRKLLIEHLTRHTYEMPVSFSEHSLFLRPIESHRRRLVRFEVATTPLSAQRWLSDACGNLVLRCNFGLHQATVLEFRTCMEMDVEEDNPFDFILEGYATGYPFNYREPDLSSLRAYLQPKAGDGSVRSLDWFYKIVPSPSAHSDVVQFLSDLNTAICRQIRYTRRDEEGIQDADTTIDLGSGSCRDMAVLFMAILRQLGFAVRFCSGYLYVPPVVEDGPPGDNRAEGSMHAWAEVYLPGAGWKGFDPTNGVLANSFYIPCAVSHAPLNVSPIQGTYFSQCPVASTMEVNLKMEAIH